MPRDWVYATTGSDATGDGTSGTPYQTPEKCFTSVAPGDTIKGRAGSYEVSLDLSGPYTDINTGTSGNPVTITNWAGETVTWTPVAGASSLLYFKPGAASYITVIGNALGEFVLDGNKASLNSNDGIRPGSGSGATSNTSLYFENLVVKRFKNQGFGNAPVDDCRVINCLVEENGATPSSGPPQTHGLYCGQWRNSLIELCTIRLNTGWGVHMYTGSSGAVGGNVVRLNKIYANGTASRGGSGVVVSGAGNNNKVWGNWVYDNIYDGIEFWGGNNNEAAHNTVDNNGLWGIIFNEFGSSSGNKAIGNLVTRNSSGSIRINANASAATVTYNFTSTAISDAGPSTTANNNTSSVVIADQVTDSTNATLASRDYTLKGTATAIDAGNSTDVGYVTTSISGVDRIQGSAIDIGGDEYTAAPPDAPLISHSSPYTVVADVYTPSVIALSDGDSNTLTVAMVGEYMTIKTTPTANVAVTSP